MRKLLLICINFLFFYQLYGLEYKYKSFEFTDTGAPKKICIEFKINKKTDSLANYPAVFMLKNGIKMSSATFSLSKTIKIDDDNFLVEETISFESFDFEHRLSREEDWLVLLNKKFNNNILIFFISKNYALGIQLGDVPDKEIHKEINNKKLPCSNILNN